MKKTTLQETIDWYKKHIELGGQRNPCEEVAKCLETATPLKAVEQYAEYLLNDNHAAVLFIIDPVATLYATLIAGIGIGYAHAKANEVFIGEIKGEN